MDREEPRRQKRGDVVEESGTDEPDWQIAADGVRLLNTWSDRRFQEDLIKPTKGVGQCLADLEHADDVAILEALHER